MKKVANCSSNYEEIEIECDFKSHDSLHATTHSFLKRNSSNDFLCAWNAIALMTTMISFVIYTSAF